MSESLCVPCTAERMRWADSKPSQILPRFGFTYGSGAAYDVSPVGLRDGKRARYEDWRRLVKSQMALVARGCREGRHAVPLDT
jgi:hypothetical protein